MKYLSRGPLFAGLILCAALCATSAMHPRQVSAAAQAAAPPPVGAPAPDFSLQTTDGSTLKLSDLRGKIVVVNFFATWCPPCRAETPDLVGSSNSFAKRDVVFVGVDAKEPAALVQQFAAAKGIAYPIVLDSDGAVNDSYDVRAIPTTYIVGRDGRIQYRQVDQLSAAVLASALDDVIAGRMPGESPLARRFAQVAADGTTQVAWLTDKAKSAQAKHDTNAAFPAAQAAVTAGVATNKQLDELQNADDQSSINYFTSTQQRDKLGAALAVAYEELVAVKPGMKDAKHDQEQALLLLGQKAEDEERFAEALDLFKQAATLAPKDTAPLDGAGLAAFEMRDYALAASFYGQETKIAPTDPETWLALSSADNSLKRYDDALANERTALALAAVHLAHHPKQRIKSNGVLPTYEVGRLYLKMGRTEVLAGDNADAAAYFAYTPAIAPGTIVAQQAQEAFASLEPQPVYVAVSGADKVAGEASKPAKLWVTVHNAAAQPRTVHLAAVNVPKKWVLSFCYDKVCDPYKSDVSLGPNASRRVELQVVPLSSTGGPWDLKLSPSGVDQMSVDVSAKTAKASITVLAS